MDIYIDSDLDHPPEDEFSRTNDGVYQDQDLFDEKEKVENVKRNTKEEYQSSNYCKHCEKVFSRRDNLKWHMKEQHGENIDFNLRNKTRCIQPNCEETLFHHHKLIEQLEREHSAHIKLNRLNFMSMKEFFTWKEAEEAKNFTYYSKQTSLKKGKSASYFYYHCKRDGHSNPHRRKGDEQRKTARKHKKGVVKTDMLCPSRMICKVDLTGVINVTYIQSHNHLIQFKDTKHHPMPNSVLENVKSKLVLGASIDNIHKDLRAGKDSSENRRETDDNLQWKHAVSKRQLILMMPRHCTTLCKS
eukprot:gene2626-3039_t